MPTGLEPPCFKLMADALLEQVRHEASCQAIAEPFMRGLPASAPGVQHSFQMLQRRLVLMAEAQRLLELMAPYEDAIRTLAQIVPGTRRVSN